MQYIAACRKCTCTQGCDTCWWTGGGHVNRRVIHGMYAGSVYVHRGMIHGSVQVVCMYIGE